MSNERSFYDILGVSRSADQAAIQAAYRGLMKKHHPDIGAGAEDKDVAAEANAAFAVLRNVGRRTQYDAELRYHEARALGFAVAQRGGPGHPVSPAQAVPRGLGRPWLFAGIAIAAAGAVAAGLLAPLAPDGDRNRKGRAEASVPARRVARAPETAPAVLPISASQAAQGSNEFARVSAQDGLGGAVAYSELCFAEQARTQRIDDLDFCMAFDRAAARRWDSLPEDDRAARPARFVAANVAARHRAALRFALVTTPPVSPVLVEPSAPPEVTPAAVEPVFEVTRPARPVIAAPRQRAVVKKPPRLASAAGRRTRRARIEPQRLPIGDESATVARAPPRSEAKPSAWKIGPQ